MNNFPISFEDYLETFSDATGKPLKTRLRRLGVAIDLVWTKPSNPKALRYYNQRFAKFLRGLNYNHLFAEQFFFKAEYVDEAQDEPEPDDTRPIIYLDENQLDRSFGDVEQFFTRELPAGHTGALIRGLGIAILNFFVLQLLRKTERIEYATGDLSFPVNLYARVDNVISLRGKSWYGETILHDRFRALQVMMELDGLNPDDSAKIHEICERMKSETLRQLVRKDYLIRLRIFELYHKVRAYITGVRKASEDATKTKEVLQNLDLLMDYVCGLDAVEYIRADRKLQVRNKIERRLAKAVGAANDDFGWHIYRGLRSRASRGKFRTEYLFQELLESDDDRLAVLNRIYRQKREEVGPGRHEYEQLPELTLNKYRPYFAGQLSFDAAADSFVLEQNAIELDLGRT